MFAGVGVWHWTLQPSSTRLVLGRCSCCRLIVNFGDTQVEQNDTSWILQFIRKHEAEPPIWRITTCCASEHKLFRLGKWEVCPLRRKSWCQKELFSEKRRAGGEGAGPGKWKVNILAAGKILAADKILEVGEDPGDQKVVLRQMPEMPRDLGQWCQRLVVPESRGSMGTDMTSCTTVPEQQWPLWREGKSRPVEHRTVGREGGSVWNNQAG